MIASIFKKYRYQLMDRRMKITPVYFLAVLALPVIWFLLVGGVLNFTALFTILGFVFLGLYFYVLAGQRFFGKKK